MRIRETREQKRASLREDVLDTIRALVWPRDEGSRVFGSKAADIVEWLLKDGWTRRDYPGPKGFERAVYAAIDHHRKAGRIEYDPYDGWNIKRA